MNLKKYPMTLLGAAVMALALDMFLAPGGIAPGGVSGLAMIVGYFADFPIGILIFLINIPIFIWGFMEFDRKFLISSVVGMIALSVFTDVFGRFITPMTDNEILQAVFGGAMMGLGMAIVFMSGATTGGSDIVAKILKKRFPYFSIGIFILIIDAVVVLLSGLVSGRWETMLFSGAALYISSRTIDGVLDGVDYSKMAFIISDYTEEIAAAISEKMQRGATVFSGYSGYSGMDKDTIMCVVRRNEIVKLKEIVRDIDRGSFVVVADVREVLGNGFAQS